MKKLTCTIPGKQVSYDIEMQMDLLDQPKFLADRLAKLGSRFAIITNANMAGLHGERLKKSLSEAGLEWASFTFPSGEQHKTRLIKEELENQLFEQGFGRDSCVIALGGGVVTDLAGFLAATYCRGVSLVMMPTSLLGMVDASIGGKTGVDVPYGKNLIGAIYQPKKVLIDLSTLRTLPVRELRNGVVEMIKHGLIIDSAYFDYLDRHAKELLELNPEVLQKVIYESCRIKKEVVESDERESGKRHLLNFGHTIGHALEHLTHYSIAHGEAVAIGLLVESHLSVQLGLLDQVDFDRTIGVLRKYGLPLQLPKRFSNKEMLDVMALDKKSLKGNPRFVMINGIGSSVECDGAYCMPVEEKILLNALDWMSSLNK